MFGWPGDAGKMVRAAGGALGRGGAACTMTKMFRSSSVVKVEERNKVEVGRVSFAGLVGA